SLKEISSRGENKRTYSPRYLDQIRERIKAQYFVPDRAKWEKMRGTVVLQVTVSTQGEIKKLTFVNHSDFPLLDMAARGTVQHAAPFPDISHLVDFKELKFIVPIKY
ncbi:TonB family protein, partial [Planctomycetota bacterium]